MTHHLFAELPGHNLMLSRKALRWLEEMTASIRHETGAQLSRSALIRGIIEGFADAGLTVRRCCTGEEVAGALETYLRGAQGRKKERDYTLTHLEASGGNSE